MPKGYIVFNYHSITDSQNSRLTPSSHLPQSPPSVPAFSLAAPLRRLTSRE